MAQTEIMTLGALEPLLRSTFLRPRLVTPQQPQNLLRQTLSGGLRSTAALLRGLGDVSDDVITSVTNAPPPSPDGAEVAMSLPTLPPLPWRDEPNVGVRLGTIAAMASLSLVSAAVSGYHGYRRDRSAMAGVGWGFMGALFPVVTPIVSFAQGYGRPRGRR